MSDDNHKPVARLRLYVTGSSVHTKTAIANFSEFVSERLQNNAEIEVIDVANDPEIAEKLKVIATPLLEIIGSSPTKRVVGDLSDIKQVMVVLDL